jgi:UDP-arabinose 4-epimerase
MARILVIGGAGYVGSHCVNALVKAGHDCVVYDNLYRGHQEFVKWGPLIVGDVRDPMGLEKAFSQWRVDAVMHFAALAYVGESTRDPGLYWDVNVNGTRTLLDAMRKHGIAHLVFSSTCAVYGQPDTLPITEQMPLNPLNPYGNSKLACERMMDDFGAAYGLRSVRLRYFNAAGADPDAGLWEWHEPETHLIPLVLYAAFGRSPQVQVYGTDFPTKDGTAIRDYIHVNDLADAHLRALNYLLGGGSTTVVNLGTEVGTSVQEVIAAAQQFTGRRVPCEYLGRRSGDPAALVASSASARQTLGWVARNGIDDVIRDAAAQHQAVCL